MNPFDSIANLWGGGSQQAAPTPSPAVNAMSNRGVIGGAMESIWGKPAAVRMKEAEMVQGQEENAALQALLPEVQKIREANPNAQPHEVMRQIIASPTFNQNALKVPAERMTKFVQDLSAATAAPLPEAFAQGGAYGTRDPITKRVTIQGQVPTADMQNFQYWQSLPPDVRQEWQGLKGARPSEKAQAIARRVARNEITQAQADFLLSGDALMTDIRDEAGNVVRREVGSRTGAPPPAPIGAAGQQQLSPELSSAGPRIPGTSPTPTQGAPAPSGPPPSAVPPGTLPATPNQVPAPFDPNEPAGARTSLLQNRADIFDAAGLPGAAANIISRGAGIVDPSAVDPVQSAKSAGLDLYRAKLQDLVGASRRLKADFEMYDRLASTSRDIWTNPVSAATTAYMVREQLDRRKQYLLEESAAYTARGKGSRASFNKMQDEIRAIDGFLLVSPTTEELRPKIEALRQGQGGTPLSAIGNALPTGRRVGEFISDAAGIRPPEREAPGSRQPQQPVQTDYSKMSKQDLQARILQPGKTLAEIQALKAEYRARLERGE